MDNTYWFKAGQTFLRTGRRDQALVAVGELLRSGSGRRLAIELLTELYGAGAIPGSTRNASGMARRVEAERAAAPEAFAPPER